MNNFIKQEYCKEFGYGSFNRHNKSDYSNWLEKKLIEARTQDVIASDFLTSRKLPYGNTMRSIFKKNPKFCKGNDYHVCERFLHEGYMLAYRRLKNNSL